VKEALKGASLYYAAGTNTLDALKPLGLPFCGAFVGPNKKLTPPRVLSLDGRCQDLLRSGLKELRLHL